MQPWGASGGPDDETLRELLRAGMSHREIAERYGVRRQTVGYWARRAGIKTGVEPMTHKDVLPWTIRGEDHHDSIARALRWYSKRKQGGALTPPQEREVERLLAFLERERVVVDYSREKGFVFRHRDAKLDKKGDIIRRPR